MEHALKSKSLFASLLFWGSQASASLATKNDVYEQWGVSGGVNNAIILASAISLGIRTALDSNLFLMSLVIPLNSSRVIIKFSLLLFLAQRSVIGPS